MTNEQFSIFMIEFSKIEARLKSLEIAVRELKQENITVIGDVKITGNIATDHVTKPIRWPNESFDEYKKRIGEYIGASIAPGVDKLN